MNRQVALGFGLGMVTTSVLIGCLTAQRPANPRPQALPTTTTPTAGVQGHGVPEFWVRPGYRVDLVAENLGNARFMEFDDKGNLYLSRPNRGDILTLRLRGNRYEIVNTFVAGYPTVHGMHFADGWLWFTQTGAIHKARDTNNDGKADEVQTVIPEGQLPRGGGHWWRPILVTDKYLYTGIGDAGNINDETETERQKIWRFNKDGTGKTLFASGIRNTEKLRLRPGTNEVWGVDHGSDWFGRTLGERPLQFQPITDYNPPDELNHYEEGEFYGHPFITGNKVPRIEYQNRKDIVELADKTVPPAWSFGAHWAANSFTFLTKDHFPGHKGDMFVACRGSWNRTVPDGYRVERVLFDPVTGRPYGSLTIVKTLVGNRVLARPVDCVEAPDGSVLFSCDTTNRIYRISWVGERNARSN